MRSKRQDVYLQTARLTYGSDDLEFDDDAAVSENPDGAFVMGWRYVTRDEAGLPLANKLDDPVEAPGSLGGEAHSIDATFYAVQYTTGGIPDTPLLFRDISLAGQRMLALAEEDGLTVDHNNEPLDRNAVMRGEVAYISDPDGDNEVRLWATIPISTDTQADRHL